MARVTDAQVRRLFRLLAQDKTLTYAALKTGMDRKTARRYRDMQQFPSDNPTTHHWRTRDDPFADVWEQVEQQLRLQPGLQAKTLFEWLQRTYPGRFQDGQLRTLQRRIKQWRAQDGPGKEIFFGQDHHPGRLAASDFTHVSDLGVTIDGQPFEHLLYHFVLTYSNWETVTVCFSESFEALSEGLQNALAELGGVPQRHRTDRLSSAVNNLSEKKEFTRRYQALMDHYQLTMEKIQAGKGNENGDVESSHRHFKTAVDQALMLRGSRDFTSRADYETFLREVTGHRNAGRHQRLQQELAVLRSLPIRRLESCQRLRVTVTSGSLIRVRNNVYSVHSRLIGEEVEVRVYAEHLEVWYGQKQVERLPRLRGKNHHRIDYRHVIDWLIRKPGAFANYRYQGDLFPTSRFRMAYDQLCDSGVSQPHKECLQLLHLAAREQESLVDEALRVLLQTNQPPSREAVEKLLQTGEPAPPVTAVWVCQTDLSCFDDLFTNKEVLDETKQGRQGDADGESEGTASADDPGDLRGAGPSRRTGDVGLRAVSSGTGRGRMRAAPDHAGRTDAAAIENSSGKGSVELGPETSADEGGSSVQNAAVGDVPGPL